MERGEKVEDAAIRETREEVGLDIRIERLLGLYSGTGETVALAVYVAIAEPGKPVASDDLDAVRWFGPDELPALAFDHDLEIVAAWRDSVPPRGQRHPEQAQPSSKDLLA